MSSIEEKARKAREKKALYGTDVDLESYETESKPQSVVEDAEDLPKCREEGGIGCGREAGFRILRRLRADGSDAGGGQVAL